MLRLHPSVHLSIDSANVKIFKSQGTALDKFAKKTVKVSHVSLALPGDVYRVGSRGGQSSQYELFHPGALRTFNSTRKLLVFDTFRYVTVGRRLVLFVLVVF